MHQFLNARGVSNISTAIDEHLKLLGTTNSQTNGCFLNRNQYPCYTNNPIFNSTTFLGSPNHNLNNYSQLVINQMLCNNQFPLNIHTQSNSIIYHSLEDCIIDENNVFDNINVLNRDETRNTKILVIPSFLYLKYLQPMLDRIKENTTNQEHELNCNDGSPVNALDGQFIAYQKEEIQEETEEEYDETITGSNSNTKIDSLSSITPKNSNNYSKISNKKGIKKKRKYLKSGLFRKDRNGNFLFSSADRSRLATLIDTTSTSASQEGSEVFEHTTHV